MDIVERITDYLSAGGLFNPELAKHDTVRDLLIDIRATVAKERLDRIDAGVMSNSVNAMLSNANEALRAELEEAKAVLETLVNRLDFVHDDSQFKSVWTLAMIHGQPYKGPKYETELNAARAFLEKHK